MLMFWKPLNMGISCRLSRHRRHVFLKNNLSSLRHEQFVQCEIQDLLAKGYIQELPEQPYCTNPLTVAVGKKLRLVLDARHVNSYLKYCPIKYEDWSLLEQVIEQEGLLYNI